MRRAVLFAALPLVFFAFFTIGGRGISEAAAADSDGLPDKASLSANRMRFDSKTGDFLATGNVVIRADGLTVVSPRGSGNIERREALFDEGVTASGDWQGDRVDLRAGSLALSFGESPSCKLDRGVRGSVGTIALDADRMTLIGRGGLSGAGEGERQTKLWLVNVRRVEDRSRDIAFGAEAVEGRLRKGVLVSMTAKSQVWVEGRPNSGGDAVSLRGDRAIYSEERGSVVLSGNVRAVQKGRTLTSDSLVYFPDQNRVEALGGIVSRSGTASADRATITIDLSQEPKRSAPASEDRKAEPKKKGKKR
mgnify:CR=1 FL=1